ncbi:hypothetical protein ONS95_011657 [Cadophora gregata]|uniref:uncharacterized protein n=1 Tax=Cadophora gregata TaxID=51156 RepID=UPI0026DACA2B|nr:uncharacterized protein ONS95_011657 [Cadophora gregata]KAK0120251.1 hypothetical protein ONS95_011657 [Cadophora gregata]KAK0121287.1 hypothetical protein ONS96_011461 [Cadophora gregata f. sp. sojae]
MFQAAKHLSRALPSAGNIRAATCSCLGFSTATPQDPVPLADNDPGGLHPVTPGDTFHESQYRVLRKLGQGRYSIVWLAADSLSRKDVALKILRADCYGTSNDIFELEMLEKISEAGYQHLQGAGQVTRLLNHFKHCGPNGNHICLVLDVWGHHIGHEAQRYSQRRIPVRVMKEVVRQILLGLDFLHRQCGIIHTDLKPSNILIDIENTDDAIPRYLQETASTSDTQPKTVASQSITEVVTSRRLADRESFKICIIDLGVSSWLDKHLSENIQPPLLRAPEVTLGAPWGPPVDIFSLGCLIIELTKGHRCFPGSAASNGAWTAEDDRLAQMIEVLGPFPDSLLSRGSKTDQFFKSQGGLRRIDSAQLESTSLKNLMDGENPALQRPADMSDEDLELLIDFLEGTLMLDPNLRKTALELLEHPWLKAEDEVTR